MKILYIGDFSENFDEGLKNIAKTMHNVMSKKHEVDMLNVKELSLIKLWRILRNNKKYDIAHYFTAPTFSSFVLLKLLKLLNKANKTVISALHPKAEDYFKSPIKRRVVSSLLRVDTILYQYNPKVYEGFARRIFFFPNGVDVNRFSPIPPEKKLELRNELGLPEDKFIVLHVGHLSKKRNIGVFEKIQKASSDIQVVIVGSTYLEKDIELYSKLKGAGCIIFTGYVPQIEKLYQVADLYVFPVYWKNSINIPLTVLEAMSTNLPVVSLTYPGLFVFKGVSGVYFVYNEHELIETVLTIKEKLSKNILDVRTREAVKKWSLENLATLLDEYYNKILMEGDDGHEEGKTPMH
ncbi:glycosyltransferase [Thermococcus sibiricus]|uniref:Glycosyltransferase n=1 Tax=Thermococcus sibiricus TaxID=172049 RepID=A0A117L103_9EURY|nr:glycosyltransferase [Thermococcus sibiricus]KUK17003.1 MAG: Glycosyltransferase [Thermococcus sibiricus]